MYKSGCLSITDQYELKIRATKYQFLQKQITFSLHLSAFVVKNILFVTRIFRILALH